MAVLQQADSQLAQKQIRKVVPISIQNQKAVDMRGQNNEATIKAVQDAIEVSAQVYKKMDDASVNLELREEQTKIKKHMNKQTVLLETNIGSISAGYIKPKLFKEQYNGEDGKYSFGISGNNNSYFTPYQVSDELSERAKEIIGTSIESANSDFVSNTQIAFSKELKKRNEKVLTLDENKLMSEYSNEIASIAVTAMDFPLYKNGESRDQTYAKNIKTAGEDASKDFKAILDSQVGLLTLTQEDADARLFKHREQLANRSMEANLAFNPKKTLERLKQGYNYEISGVPVNGKVRDRFVSREAENRYFRDQKWNLEAAYSHIRTGMNSKFILDKVSFINNNYTIDGNKLTPKKSSIQNLSKQFKVLPEEVDLFLQKSAEGQKPLVPGQGIEDNDYRKLVNSIENDMAKLVVAGSITGEETWKTAEKDGILKLLNKNQFEELTKYKSGWDKVVLFSNQYSKEKLPYLIKRKNELRKEFTTTDKKFKKQRAVLEQFINSLLNPRIEEMSKTPKTFIIEELGYTSLFATKDSNGANYQPNVPEKAMIVKSAERWGIKLNLKKEYWISEAQQIENWNITNPKIIKPKRE